MTNDIKLQITNTPLIHKSKDYVKPTPIIEKNELLELRKSYDDLYKEFQYIQFKIKIDYFCDLCIYHLLENSEADINAVVTKNRQRSGFRLNKDIFKKKFEENIKDLTPIHQKQLTFFFEKWINTLTDVIIYIDHKSIMACARKFEEQNYHILWSQKKDQKWPTIVLN